MLCCFCHNGNSFGAFSITHCLSFRMWKCVSFFTCVYFHKTGYWLYFTNIVLFCVVLCIKTTFAVIFISQTNKIESRNKHITVFPTGKVCNIYLRPNNLIAFIKRNGLFYFTCFSKRRNSCRYK